MASAANAPRAFVTGWPVSHSLSPALHTYWLHHHGLAGSYELQPVKPEEFANFLRSFPKKGFVGGNVTIPHKEVAFAGLDALDPTAKALGAVNTLWLEGDKIVGGNTDAYGFTCNLDDQVPEWRNGKTAIILGAGGASRAVIHAIQTAGFRSIHVLNRTVERAQNLVSQFGEPCAAHPLDAFDALAGEADLLVNATSLGMGDDGTLPVSLSTLGSGTIVTDIIYTPLETAMLHQARERGLPTADGLGMLLHQAVPGFEKWFGHRPEVTQELRNHILQVIAAERDTS